MKNLKKILACFLTVLMIISVVPLSGLTASATTAQDDTGAVTETAIQIFDLQNAESDNYAPGEEMYYAIPKFSYKVTMSDSTSFVKSSSEADEKLIVTHNQAEKPWEIGGDENYITVSYGAASTSVAVQLINTNNYQYYTEDDKAYITYIYNFLGKELVLPSVIDGFEVIGIKSIGSASDYAESIIIPDTIEYIETGAFRYNNSIKTITIGAEVKSLNVEIFSNCKALESITVSEDNEKYCDINGVVYNKDITQLIAYPNAKEGTYKVPATISDLSGLAADIDIEVDSKSKYFTTVSGVTYNKAKTKVIRCNKTKSGSYTMPDTVKTIADGAFSDCKKITKVTISDSVTEIAYHAFYNCKALESVKLPSNLKSIDAFAFENTSALTSISFPSKLKSIGTQAFYNSGLKSIKIPDSVTSIGDYAFADTKATSLSIGKGLKTIMPYVFYSNPLKSVTIPNNVTSISCGAFANCTKLKTLTIGTGVKKIDSAAFSNCTSLKSIIIPNNVTEIGGCVFADCTNATSLKIGTGIKNISSGAFSDCSSLTSVTIPNNITSILDNAFGNCSKLSSISIGKSVKELSIYAFANCYKLSDITIDSANKYYSALNGGIYNKKKTEILICPSAKNYVQKIANTVTVIGQEAFFNNTKIKTVEIPDSVTDITYFAFAGCSNLTSVKIPKKVTSIDIGAFSRCEKLVSVTIPKSVKTIGSYAFAYCDNLKHVFYEGTAAQWKKISIADGNESLLNATIHYKSKGCKHKYDSSGTDLTCNTCGYYETDPVLRKVKGKLYYYNEGVRVKKDTRFKHTDGKWYEIDDGIAKLAKPEIEKQPKKTSVTEGDKAKFTVDATGNGLKYQWQVKSSAKSGWKNSGGAGNKTDTLKVSGKESYNGSKYRCVITDENGNKVTTKEVKLTVVSPKITKQPTKATVKKGSTAKFKVTATGNGLKYKWQYKADGSKTWKTVTNASGKTKTLKITAKSKYNGYSYRCVITDENGNKVTSKAVKLKIKK